MADWNPLQTLPQTLISKHPAQAIHLVYQASSGVCMHAAAAWDPFLKKDIALLEDVQKFALRVCTKTWDTNYDDLLLTSHLPPQWLQERRQQTKLGNLFNIINELTFFPDTPTQVRRQIYPSRSVHARALVPLQSHSLQYYNSFFPSAIAVWNSLPSSVVSATSYPAFKQVLCSPSFISWLLVSFCCTT